MPIIRHELGLPYMNIRGKKVKFVYTQFAQNLAKDAGRYLPLQPQKPAARTADVHSMHSNKIPITMRTTIEEINNVTVVVCRALSSGRRAVSPVCGDPM